MSPRKEAARQTRSTRQLALSKQTIKDLTPTGHGVKGGRIPMTTETVPPPPTVSRRAATC